MSYVGHLFVYKSYKEWREGQVKRQELLQKDSKSSIEIEEGLG